MHKQKALAFFDLAIREDQSALSALYSNEFAEGGLRLEFRHFQDEGP
jgi:hypothetical protein